MQQKRDTDPIDLGEAAERLGISRGSVYNLIQRGKLPYVKLGRRTLVLPEDLEALLRSSRMQK